MRNFLIVMAITGALLSESRASALAENASPKPKPDVYLQIEYAIIYRDTPVTQQPEKMRLK